MMAYQRYLVLIVVVAFVAVILGKEEPCIKSRMNCTMGVGYSSLVIINDEFYCCAAGHTMRWDGTRQCFCHKTSDVVPCSSSACSGYGSIANPNSKNNMTECCEAGMYMNVFKSVVNGSVMESCACSNSSTSKFEIYSYIGNNTSHINITNYMGMPDFDPTPYLEWISQCMASMKKTLERLFGSDFFDLGDDDDDLK